MSDSNLVQSEKDLKLFFMSLVEEAVSHQSADVTTMSQFYLVNLLDSFSKTAQLFDWKSNHYEETPLAILLAKAMESDQSIRIKVFKKIGDTSLYLAGYFSDHIETAAVDVDYYISMGEGAYQNLSNLFVGEKTFRELYGELANKFDSFVEILSEIRDMEEVVTNTEIVRLYERWLRTGDERIRERLEKKGIVPQKNESGKKH